MLVSKKGFKHENWKPTKRKDNSSKEIIDYEDYSQWLKNKGIGVDGE